MIGNRHFFIKGRNSLLDDEPQESIPLLDFSDHRYVMLIYYDLRFVTKAICMKFEI